MWLASFVTGVLPMRSLARSANGCSRSWALSASSIRARGMSGNRYGSPRSGSMVRECGELSYGRDVRPVPTFPCWASESQRERR